MKKTKVIAFANNKGGSGKTTSVSNVGHAMAKMGYRVLLIDADMQVNLTLSFFDEEMALGFAGSGKNLFTAVKGERDVADFIVNTPYAGLDIVPSTPEMSNMEFELFTKWQREFILKKILAPTVARGIYDAWGIEGSMSGAIEKWTAKQHTYTIPVPAEVKKTDNLTVVALLMDAYTGEVIAAEKAKLGEEKLTAIGAVTKSEMNASISATEGAVIVSAVRATAKIYSLDGKLLATQSVNGTATIPTNGWSGTVIVRVENGNDVVVKKIVL